MSLCPQEPHKKNDHSNQNRRKKSRPNPRILRFPTLSCIAIISAHFTTLPSAVYQLVTDAQLPEKGVPPLSSPVLQLLYNEEIHDQTNEDDIDQRTGKNDTIRQIFFAQKSHSNCPTSWPYICKASECAPTAHPLLPQTGLHPKAASRVIY